MFESVQAVKAVSEASNLFHAPPSLKLQRTDLHQYLQDRHEEYDDDVLGQRCCFSAAQKPSLNLHFRELQSLLKACISSAALDSFIKMCTFNKSGHVEQSTSSKKINGF